MRLPPESDPETGWEYWSPPAITDAVYGIGETGDGTIWVGGYGGLRYFDGTVWNPPKEEDLVSLPIDFIKSGVEGDIWIGTRTKGLYRYHEGTWTQYDTDDGLLDNSIRSILIEQNGNVIIATNKGISGYAQKQWVTDLLPD